MNQRTWPGDLSASFLLLLGAAVVGGCAQPTGETGEMQAGSDDISAEASNTEDAPVAETTEVPAASEADPELEAAIRAASPDYTSEMVAIGNQEGRYAYARVDLDHDGRDEAVVYLLGSIFCGSGGCDLLVFRGGETGHELVGSFPISRVPVIVSPERTAGWSDIVKLESGGGAPSSWVTYAFEDGEYMEKGRSPGETEPAGVRVLAGEITFDGGIPLPPAN